MNVKGTEELSGNASVNQWSQYVLLLIAITPIVISTGAVACGGTNKNNRTRHKYKRPVTTAVRPVRPASATAAALNIK